ncbi:MAG: hypothetical protein L0H79_20145 [Intrasporangium sp.]|uniref:hypothetical protein n=1 Tax=Intrasporangium sp. TaxID=1925024 RepID=UPI00264922D7|nr:hypothetical protein [Intrasporangium sp.]MDN5798036.1 hypothetical protein [Intrasporangium sp.]
MSCPPVTAPTDHDRLRLGLMNAGLRLRDAVQTSTTFEAARAELTRYCLFEVLPHLEQDEAWLTRAEQCPAARPLAQAMRAETRVITAAILELQDSDAPCEVVAVTRVLHTLLALHEDHQQRLVTAIAATK